jgi:hypothetical protein
MGVGMKAWYEVGGFGHTGPSNTIQNRMVMDYAHGEPQTRRGTTVGHIKKS